jgi:hypothetical protein
MTCSELEFLSIRADRIFLDLHDRSSRDKKRLMPSTKQRNCAHIDTHLIDRYRDRVVVVGVADLKRAVSDLVVRKLSTRLDAKLLSRTLSPRHIRDEMDDTRPDKPNCDSDQDPSPEEVARDDLLEHRRYEKQKILTYNDIEDLVLDVDHLLDLLVTEVLGDALVLLRKGDYLIF